MKDKTKINLANLIKRKNCKFCVQNSFADQTKESVYDMFEKESYLSGSDKEEIFEFLEKK